MKNQKGITLVSLAVTVVIMAILAGVATYVGSESIQETKRTTFISELEMIQAKVNTIYEKIKTNEQDRLYYTSTIGQDLTQIEASKLNEILQDTKPDGFRYFSKDELKKLDLQNIRQNVLINFNTREVISVDGIIIDKTKYFRLRNMPNYSTYDVGYINKNTQSPTFEVEITKLENSWKLTLTNIVYGGNVEGGTLSHKLATNTNWIIDDYLSFEVSELGIYDIKFTDKAGNSTTIQKEIYEPRQIYIDNFNTFTHPNSATTVNSCSNGILDLSSTTADPKISMYNITSFNPKEYRYIEIRYKTTNNTQVELYMIENPTDQTYAIKNTLIKDGQWHTVIVDLWSNENIKNRENITGWRFDWASENAVSMQIDYFRIIDKIPLY